MLKYSEVTERHDKVIILCSGPSICNMTLRNLNKSNCPIIAVNGGIEIYPNCNYWITIDPSNVNYKRMRNKVSGTKYYCGVPSDYGQPDAEALAHRKTLLPHVHYLKRELSSLNGLVEDKSSICTLNSGLAALNLAYHMGAKKILYLGLDGGGNYRYNKKRGPRPNDMKQLNELFMSFLPQIESEGIEIINGSPISTVKVFNKMRPFSGLGWITKQ